MPKTDFTTEANGFHFTNRFVNNVVALPIYGKISTYGRCGGMSFAALDCYFSHFPVPTTTDADYPQTGGVPADGTPLADYIYHRQIDSFLVPSAAKFVTWSVAPDASTYLLRGVRRWTHEDEIPKLRSAIDQKKPVPLGLIVATNLNDMGHNHQVVAYGYDQDAAAGTFTVYIYDNNHPGTDVTLVSAPDGSGFMESTGEKWRGYFVQDYSPIQPPAVIATARPASLAVAKSLLPTRTEHLTVTFDGIELNAEGDNTGQIGERLGLTLGVNDHSVRWPPRGTRLLKPGKHYAIGTMIEVDVAEGDTLSISAHALAPKLGALTLSDNDQPAAAIRTEFHSADQWGNGQHKDSTKGVAGGYTIEYTVHLPG